MLRGQNFIPAVQLFLKNGPVTVTYYNMSPIRVFAQVVSYSVCWPLGIQPRGFLIFIWNKPKKWSALGLKTCLFNISIVFLQNGPKENSALWQTAAALKVLNATKDTSSLSISTRPILSL